MRYYSGGIPFYATERNTELVGDAKMGKYYHKLYRCSSVPNELTTKMNVNDTSIWQTYNLDPYDLEVDISVKDSITTRTTALLLEDWTHDRIGHYKNSNKGIVLDTVDEPTAKAGMPSRKVTTNRRQARAYIFDDIKEEDISNLLERKSLSDCTDIETDKMVVERRCALGDIFQGVKTEDMENLISNEFSGHYYHNRRCGLGNIFTGISEEDINDLSKCADDETCSPRCPENCRSGRRCALGDIFGDIEAETIYERLFGDHNDDISSFNEKNKATLNTRRFALADIFSDVPEDDLSRILYEFDPVMDENDNGTKGAS